MNRALRFALAPVVALSLSALASLAPLTPLAQTCAGAGSNHAAVVVEHGDGSVVTRCVAFDASEITGEQLLDISGIGWYGQTFGGFGAAVCALDGEPAHYSVCPGKDRYWAVFAARDGGSWQLTSVGISGVKIRDGDAEGFRYVPVSGVPAAPTSGAGVCAAAAPTPTPRASQAAGGTSGPSATAPAPSASETTSASATAAVGGETASPGPTGATTGSGDSSPPGPDPGLLLAAGVGGGLAGLAILRVMAGRRSGTGKRPDR
jgi:hypothetical protein